MSRALYPGVLLLAVTSWGHPAAPDAVAPFAARSCAELTGLTIPDVAITSAQDVAAGPFTPPGGRPLTVPAFCRVDAVATPTTDSQIRIEVWIPAGGAWNGKLLGTGTGGFAGAIGYGAPAPGIRGGYATAGPHTRPPGGQLQVGRGEPQKKMDLGPRRHPRETAPAQLIVR